MSDLDKISSVFNAKIDSVKTKDDLQNIKTEFFGKNGEITQQFKSLGSLDSEKRKEFASNLNKIKDDLTNQLEQKILRLKHWKLMKN
jgi:phenylalanyl-tRNA synthetase alpha chain